MLEYAVAIHRRFDRYPRQLVLYVGEKPARMKDRIEEPELSFRCAIRDIRELDGEALLASDSLEDNLIGILGRLPDEAGAVRRVLEKIAESAPEMRAGALAELTILARLRNLVPLLEKETERMPILEDIMDHEIIGRERKRGIAIGREEGRQEGRQEGERKVIVSLLEERFGPLPPTARERIDQLGEPELATLTRRLLKAESIKELLG